MGKREPTLTSVTDFVSGDLVRGVKNNASVNFTFNALFNAMSGLTTLNQVGDPLAAPILDQPGEGINNFRNLESGAGMIFSVSAQNGIIGKWNVAQNDIGTPITSGLNNKQPVLSSFLPGAGMEITKVNDVITFTATGTALPATKVVTINQMSDFPAPSAGVITLEPNTVYVISNNVSTADRFVRQDNTSIVGYSQLGPTLTYTGTGTMFTSVDSSTLIFGLRLNCPKGKVFDWSDTTGNNKVETIKETRIDSCVDFGDFTGGLALVIFSSGVFFLTGRGAQVIGSSWSLVSIERFSQITSNASFVGVDLTSSTSSAVEIDNLVFIAPPGAVGITGLASSGNITAGNLGVITGCNFIGGLTPITNINPVSDLRWASRDNDKIGNSRDDSLISIQSNTSETVIATISTPVKMAGTWIDEDSSRFTVTLVGGRMTYNGEQGARLPISATVSIVGASGGDKQVSAYIAINGSVVAATKIVETASSSKAGTINLIWQHDFQTNDFVEIFLGNESDTTNLIGQSAVVRID